MELLRIFLSYDVNDTTEAECFEKSLKYFQIAHFFAPKLEYGKNFQKEIDEYLDKATHVICLVSQNSLKSGWVHYEITQARNKNIRIVVVLLQPQLPLEPVFDSKINYLKCFDILSIDILEIMSRLIGSGIFGDGIVPVRVFKEFKHRFPEEVFSSELLTQPVFIRSDGGKITITVNREDVKYVVISTKGKTKLHDEVINKRSTATKVLKHLDQEILDFLRKPKDGKFIRIDTGDMPLRWSSGGVLSIVKWNHQEWVPLFFRDIPPYGWNISLGASERSFDSDANYDGVSLEEELHSPWKLQLREFIEETLVLENYPQGGAKAYYRKFKFPPNLLTSDPFKRAQYLSKELLNQRIKKDGLLIEASQKKIDINVSNPTNIFLNVLSNSLTNDELDEGAWNVLVVINPLELGIEVVNIFEYELEYENCLLDGEIYNTENGPELVRMPVALVSLEYLFKNFGSSTFIPEYTDSQVMPSVKGLMFKYGQIVCCNWDIRQRQEIWGGPNATNWQKQRYRQWQINFEENFKKGFKGNIENFPYFFTPATAKIINLFFNCTEKGMQLAKFFNR